MRFDEYRALDATAMAEGVAKGQFTAEELLRAASRRMRSVNPRINAVVLDLADEAEKQVAAGLPEGPLTGIPFLVKDMDGMLKGYPCTAGSRSLAGWVPDHDSNLFARYRAGGVMFLGKTNCPEFGIMGITEPELHGPTRNPWNLDNTPGGSSGGSAAAVAAGVVPAAHAGDGGGSIRIPAAYCGLFGLKPTRGRMPLGPDVSQGWSGLVVPNVVSRSVRDTALFLTATHGRDLGAPIAEPGGDTDFMRAARKAPRKLRIGVSRQAFFGESLHPDIVPAVDDAVALLEDLGHTVEQLELTFEPEAMATAYLSIVAAGVAADVARTQTQTGVKPRPELFERATWFLSEIGKILSARDLEQVQSATGRFGRDIAEQLEGYDVHVSATTAYPQAVVGELDMSLVQRLGISTMRRVAALTGPLTDPVYRQALGQLAGDSLSRTPNTQIFNMTGQPAMSVPLWWTPSGLPVGVQFAAGFGEEALLLQLAGQLEEARPWFGRVPPL